MIYDEALSFLKSLTPLGMNLGLERISSLLNELGNPQNNLKFIHIAGTNGKGSSASMMSEVLKCAGYKTGLFTSPFVLNFREQIQINNDYIDCESFAKHTEVVSKAIAGLSEQGVRVTEFEAVTAIALLYFKTEKCDYVVLEVGLGGRLDSTNVIPCPEVAVFTSVSTDHTAVLGDTIEKIATEKCGIIKHGGKVVTTSLQNEKALEIIRKTVASQSAVLTLADYGKVEIVNADVFGTDFLYDKQSFRLNLSGIHQLENALGVIEAVNLLRISYDNINTGLRNTVMHGRMEVISKTPFVLTDGGHNEECSLALKAVLCEYNRNDITAVIGMMADKECEKYLRNILPFCKSAVLTVPQNPRSEKAENLEKIAKQFINDTVCIDAPQMAYKKALSLAGENGFVLVCGSFYLLRDVFGK